MPAITTQEQADAFLHMIAATPRPAAVYFPSWFGDVRALAIDNEWVDLDPIDWARCVQRQRPSRGWRKHVRRAKRLQRSAKK